MRKIFLTMALVMSVIMVLSVGAWTDTQHSATVTLVLQDVINVSIVSNLLGATVTQPDLETRFLTEDFQVPLGTLTVQLVALTDYMIDINFEADSNLDPNLASYPFPDNPPKLTYNGAFLTYIPEDPAQLDITNLIGGLPWKAE